MLRDLGISFSAQDFKDFQGLIGLQVLVRSSEKCRELVRRATICSRGASSSGGALDEGLQIVIADAVEADLSEASEALS